MRGTGGVDQQQRTEKMWFTLWAIISADDELHSNVL